MGQNVSTQAAAPHFAAASKGKGKGRRQTAEPIAPLPKRAKSLTKRRTLDEQLAARFMAESKLEGRSPRLIILDTAASPQWGRIDDDEKVEGLRINVDGRRLDRPRTTLDSSVSKFPPPILRGISDESLLISLPPSSFTAVDDHPPHQSPTSHWSESSAGMRTPPQTFQSFLESAPFSTNPKRMSTQSSAYRSSNIFSIEEGIPSAAKPLQKVFEKGLQSYRVNKENERKRKAAKKRGPIVVVGAQRVGSGRYSMMKEAAVRSAAARRESLAPKEGAVSRRGSKDGQGRRRSSASEGRRVAGRRASEPTNSPSDSPTRPPLSSRRSSSHNDLMSFIAASPDLTCPDPSRPPFELQAVPRPSIARLPAGHPGNHHSRFRAFNEHVASLPPPPAVSSNLAGPVLLPPRGVLSQRRPSNLSSSTRSSIVSMTALPPQDEVVVEHRRPSTASVNSRKLSSNFRLSIAEPRADDDEGDESRRGSVNSWATTSRSRKDSTECSSSSRTDAGSTSEASKARRESSVSLSALVASPDRRRSSASSVPFLTDAPALPTARSASLASRASFPHSVAYTTDSSPTARREQRHGSAMSYFTLPSSHPDLPLTPESFPESLRTPRPANMGAISWDGYSLTTPPAEFEPRSSVVSVAASDIAPETVGASPSPSNIPRLRVHAPSPLILSNKKHQPFIYDSSDLVLSDVSTPSTASFDSSSGTSTSSNDDKFQQDQDDTFVIGTGEGFAHTLGALSNRVLAGEQSKAPPSPTPSLGGYSANTFTMDDLMQLGGNSWSPAEVVHARNHSTTTVASFPVVSSSPVDSSEPVAIARRRPSEHQLETASPNLSLPAQPLPSPTSKRAPPPVFSDWKIRVDSTAALVHRLPTVVSPTTDPFTSGYMEDSDDDEDVSPSFVRVVTTPVATATHVGLKSFLDCSPTPPPSAPVELPAPISVEEPRGLGFVVDRPSLTSSSNARGFASSRREFTVDSQRRGTHPLDWTPPSMRKSGGFEALMEGSKGRSASEDHGVARLGSMSKRGFNKSEVSDWLTSARKEIVPVVRQL